MAFITHDLSSSKRTASRPLGWLLLLLALPFSPARAEAITIESASTRLDEGVYLLDAGIDYRFNDKVLEALDNGVPITMVVDIEVSRYRKWWLDATVAQLEQRYRLHYHALSHQYLLHNLNSGALYAYPGLNSALHAMGRINGLPLLDQRFIDQGERYEVLLRARLDIEALPSPLRPLAYITPAWRLRSDWQTCSLMPSSD